MRAAVIHWNCSLGRGIWRSICSIFGERYGGGWWLPTNTLVGLRPFSRHSCCSMCTVLEYSDYTIWKLSIQHAHACSYKGVPITESSSSSSSSSTRISSHDLENYRRKTVIYDIDCQHCRNGARCSYVFYSSLTKSKRDMWGSNTPRLTHKIKAKRWSQARTHSLTPQEVGCSLFEGGRRPSTAELITYIHTYIHTSIESVGRPLSSVMIPCCLSMMIEKYYFCLFRN